MAIADDCRRHERLWFDYTSPRGGSTVRSVEPHSLVSFGRRWYLVAWDTDRDDWRTFRVDRLTPRTPTGPRFAPREPPDGDVATYLSHQLSARTWPFQATVTLHEPADAVADRVWPGMGVVEAVDDRRCLLHVGADGVSALVWMITSVDTDFTLTSGPPELADAFHTQAARCLHALETPKRPRRGRRAGQTARPPLIAPPPGRGVRSLTRPSSTALQVGSARRSGRSS